MPCDCPVDRAYTTDLAWVQMMRKCPCHGLWKPNVFAGLRRFPWHESCNGRGCGWHDAATESEVSATHTPGFIRLYVWKREKHTSHKNGGRIRPRPEWSVKVKIGSHCVQDAYGGECKIARILASMSFQVLKFPRSLGSNLEIERR
jgi:hypothetical protein